MTDLPFIMSAPMVAALLREIETPGTGKTMTRRLAWQRKKNIFGAHSATAWQKVRPGDRLWVREVWSAQFWNPENIDGAAREYWETPKGERTQDLLAGLYWREAEEVKRSPFDFVPEGGWTSPIHMFRWASRLTLVVTGARVEKLQEISEADAKAEGVEIVGVHIHRHYRLYQDYLGHTGHGHESAVKSFSTLWRSLHTKPGTTWDVNPDVVALSFDPHYCNIDRMEKEGEVA